MSIKRISRRRVVAPIVQYVDKDSLATTKEGRKTPQDDRHAPDRHGPDRHGPDRHAPGKGPLSPEPLRAAVPINKASVPINKYTPPTNRF